MVGRSIERSAGCLDGWLVGWFVSLFLAFCSRWLRWRWRRCDAAVAAPSRIPATAAAPSEASVDDDDDDDDDDENDWWALANQSQSVGRSVGRSLARLSVGYSFAPLLTAIWLAADCLVASASSGVGVVVVVVVVVVVDIRTEKDEIEREATRERNRFFERRSRPQPTRI